MRDLLPILVALFVLLGGAFAVAVAVVMLSSGSCGPLGQQVGVVLVYQLDPQPTPDSEPVDMQALVGVVDRRINTRAYPVARVRRLDDRTIEIGVFGSDARRVRRIERLLERAGTLELRILANQHDHKSLIDRAQAQDADVLKDASGEVQAWWVPVRDSTTLEDPGYVGFATEDWDIAKRTRKQDRREVVEVLVVNDSFDVTEAYLEGAKADFERLCVTFELNSAGAPLLLAMTGDNLPDPLQGFARRLGIIVDGQLYSAPAIENPVSRKVQITGTFTREEIADLVDALNAGSLPARIKQIDKRVTDGDP
ncbi:MAG: SecDF P1 head subdomain-containing protein [Planctomycetota bacterium]|jgi:SecD/SecF fusion protein